MLWYQTQFVWGSHAPIKIEITLFSNPAHSLQCFVSACLYLKTYSFAPIINYVTAFPSYSITKCMCTYSSRFQPSICNQKALRAQKAPQEFLRIISSLTHKMCHTLLQWHFQSADFFKDLCYCNISCCSNIPKTISTAAASAISLLSS